MAKQIKAETAPHVLIYGIERFGVHIAQPHIPTGSITLDFEAFDTDKKFHDYDGVIVFQSTFEKINLRKDWSDTRYWDVTYNKEELLRRQTQVRRLLENGGWICFILHTHFIDGSRGGNEFSQTDLCKLHLNYNSCYRKPFATSRPIDHIKRSEFDHFLKEFGAASTYFDIYNDWVEENSKVIATVGNQISGFILMNSVYFVPARLPTNSELIEFFTKLGSALVSTAKKLVREIPSWAEEYRLHSEKELLDKEAVFQQQLIDVRCQLDKLALFKGVLCFEGDSLVDAIKSVLRNGLGLKLSDKGEEFLEDTMILDDTGQDSVLVEIKGMNENLKSQHIYQADGHRGRRDKPPQFPSILIANTFIKSSNAVEDKLRDFNSEQIKLAASKHVLAMRTIDLLNLMRLSEQGKLSSEQIHTLIQTEVGWLKVSDDTYEIRKE